MASASWSDNLLLRREIYLLTGLSRDGDAWETATRWSAGFEAQKRFSTATRTLASLDYQGRLAYRDPGPMLSADPMGADAGRWEYETHNAYLDVYNILGAPGRVNLRAGHFYQPFGLNTQTDTHGTLLQLSNERVFGSERDWQAVLYGELSDALDYQVGYLLGGGMDSTIDGQTGMGVARVSLDNDWLFQHGTEGGISLAAGERLGPVSVHHGGMEDMAAGRDGEIRTLRVGLDARQRLDTGAGPFTVTAEGAAGADDGEPMVSALAQLDWREPGRRWGSSAQYNFLHQQGGGTIAERRTESAIGTLTRYFQNDVGNATLHWVTLGVEHPLVTGDAEADTIYMVQYYRYW